MDNLCKKNTKLINVLFLGAGRRVSMAILFKKRGFRVFSYEESNNNPIGSEAKIIIGKKWNNPDFVGHLLKIIKEYDIDIVIPFLSEASMFLTSELMNRCVVLNPLPYVSNICCDKLLFEKFIMENFLKNYPKNDKYPKLAKPRFGCGGRGIIKINNYEDEKIIRNKKDYIIQSVVLGEEYSVDAYFDKNGFFIDAVPRIRIKTGGGEVVSSKTVKFNELIYLTEAIGSKLGYKGVACFQYIVSDEDIYIIEINSRFGGGATLSIEAGFDIISCIKKDFFGKNFYYEKKSWKNNLLMERCYKDFFYEI